MTVLRHFRRLVVLAGALAFALSWATSAQEVSVQQLIERGALNEAAQRAEAERENPEAACLVAHAFLRMKDDGRANEVFGRLRESGGEDWKAIGESGATLLAGDQAGAQAAAERAVAANAGNPYAHYQLGAVSFRQNNFERAAEAFGQSVQLKPDLAYAHYYAGMAYQRLKQTAKMSEHLETFLKLAPNAPERAMVSSMLRTLRG